MSDFDKLAAYLDAADRDLIWTVGNRHHTLVSLASTCNKAGFSESDLICECCRRYSQSSFPDEEIRETISDVYKRYSSDHGINRKTEYVPKRDKRTKGQIDISKETGEETLDPENILKAKCPDVEKIRKYIPKTIYDHCTAKVTDPLIIFLIVLALIVAMGAMIKKARCWLKNYEFVYTYLYLAIFGPPASGKNCIEKIYKFFRIYANDIENESEEEVRKEREAYKAWKKCVSLCKDEDCGCGAEPVVPERKRLSLSLSTSQSKMIHQLVSNGDFPALIYNSEMDSIMNIKDFPLSPVLRAAWGNEPISSLTYAHGDNTKQNPKISMLIAGTPNQVVRVINNKEDGLASRCLSVSLSEETPYDPLGEDDFDYKTHEIEEEGFKMCAKTFGRYAMNTQVDFKLTKASRQKLDDYYRSAEQRCAIFCSVPLTSFLRRLRRNNVAMAQVLAFSHLYELNKESGEYYIPDEIIDIVCEWNDFLIEQHIRLLFILPETPENEGGNEFKYAELFNQLPCKFTFGEACKIGEPILGASKKTIQRSLKRWVNKRRLVHIKQMYHKVDCPDCPPVS